MDSLCSDGEVTSVAAAPAAMLICRTCLSNSNEVRSIYKKGVIGGQITKLADMLACCTNLEFVDDDGLPAHLCKNCVSHLSKAYAFIRLCIQSDDTLRLRIQEQVEQQYMHVVAIEQRISSSGSVSNATEEIESPKKTDDDVKENVDEESTTKYNYHIYYHINSSDASREPIEWNADEQVEEKNSTATINDRANNYKCNNEIVSTLTLPTEDEQNGELQAFDHDEDQTSENPQIEETANRNASVHDIDMDLDIVAASSCPIENVNFDLDADKQQEIDYDDEEELHLEEDDEEEDSTAVADDDDPLMIIRKCNKQPQQHDETENPTPETDAPEANAVGKIWSGFAKPQTPQRRRSDRKIPTERRRKRAPGLDRPPGPPFECPECNKKLSNYNSYKYHMRLHSDETPFVCKICNASFKTPNAFDGHMKTHDANNPHTCEVCHKSYRQAASLRNHMLTHTGERPFKCTICGKGMTQKSGYKKHMLTHSGEKPYKCDVCNKHFRYSSNLFMHKRSHSNEKPNVCEVCGKAFVTTEQLKRHRSTHSSEKNFECDLCGQAFNRKATMKSHRERHFRQNNPITVPMQYVMENDDDEYDDEIGPYETLELDNESEENEDEEQNEEN